MHIHYKTDTIPATPDIIELYDKAVLKRPAEDPGRIARMYENSNLAPTFSRTTVAFPYFHATRSPFAILSLRQFSSHQVDAPANSTNKDRRLVTVGLFL